MRKFLKIAGIVIGAVLGLAVIYVAYVFISYHRIDDNQDLTVDAPRSGKDTGSVTTGQIYSAMSYNIGFGAYLPDYSFFMDGGDSSWAKSQESVYEALNIAAKNITDKDPDFVLLQEVDYDSTRSYHVNQYNFMKNRLWNYESAMAIDYDSAFLMYPFYKPHGKSISSLGLFSKYEISSSVRRKLPISTGFSKLLDLDRCYSVSRIPVDNGKELVIFTVHLSAYGGSDEIRSAQTGMLTDNMQEEYDKGNYVICGGDFNHDLKADEADTSECESWAYPFPRSVLSENFSFAMDFLTENERENLWNSARNADIAYDPDESYTVTLDGFIISDNITLCSYENIETGYSASDHDPVYMTFMLN